MNKIPTDDLHMLEQICQTIYDKKGFNAITLDVRPMETFTDYFVIAEGNVEKHVQSLSKELQEVLREQGRHPVHVEGQRQGDWVVLDFSEVVIHLFIPDMREKYQLEHLWQQAEIVDVPIHVGAR
jgi:ribosome-associated protein